MALTAEEEMLISIIEFNQKRIEELLISRSQSYQVQTNFVKPSPTVAPKMSIPATNGPASNKCVVSTTSASEKIVPQILTTFFKDSADGNAGDVDTTAVIAHAGCHDQSENSSNIIVDHTVPLPDPIESCESSMQVQHTEASIETTKSVVVKGNREDESELSTVSIPGLGQDNCSTESAFHKKTENDDLNCHDVYMNTAEKKSNVWIINKNGKRRKKARSSSPSNELKNKAEPSCKRKRCNSSSSLIDSTRFDNAPSSKSIEGENELKQITEIVIDNKLESVSINDAINECSKEFSTLPMQREDSQCSKTAILPKKKTIILSSPMKRRQIQNPKTSRRTSSKFNTSSSNCLEPYVACWAHCPAISARVPSAHCVPKHQFLDHLREYHTPPRSINLRNQQIVCICHACETVVPYTFKSKTDHLNQRCTKWHQQFFLFIENAQDNFAIPRFNAPVVKSPGLAGMFKSIAHHPHLDTLTWKNVKNEHFCYHFCRFCNVFVEDTMRAVSDHKSTALHRVNVRKSTN
jgi:hypothetical protein